VPIQDIRVFLQVTGSAHDCIRINNRFFSNYSLHLFYLIKFKVAKPFFL